MHFFSVVQSRKQTAQLCWRPLEWLLRFLWWC